MNRKPYVAREHEFEAQHGLPEKLPAGERILWQGAPRWSLMARQVFHADKAAAYFAVILAWRVASRMADGAGLAEALASLTMLLPLFALASGALFLMGWLSARTTAYTLTDKRVVMRVGIVLTVTYNLPLRCIQAAGLRSGSGGRGDITLALEPETRIAWLQLWPHARPWRVQKVEPMLRALDDVEAVAARLRRAWAEVNGTPSQAATAPLRDAVEARPRQLAMSTGTRTGSPA